MMRFWGLVVLLGLALSVQAAEVQRFYGFAYDLKTERHLYTEVHEQELKDGRWQRGRTDYYLPDGRLLGHKTLDFSAAPFIPAFRLDMPINGYQESLGVAGKTLTLERRERRDAKPKTKTLTIDGPTCADAGFHAFLVAHFERLLAGETVELHLVAAGSLDQFRFRARRIDDTRFEDRPAVRFRIEPDSLLRFLIDPLEMTYDPQAKRLLEYRGVTNLIDPQTNRLFVARIVYPSQPPADVGKLPPLEP